MHALIVVAHHDPQSLTHSVAAEVGAGLTASGHTFEMADLAAEGFDPRYTAADHQVHRTRATPPADVLAEQARIDRADALVLAFPIYWWSLPGLLKGWIDRVFISGWAFRFEEGKIVGAMRDIPVYLLGIGGGSDDGYTKHGYYTAFDTQVTTGIFKFCGARRVYTHLLLDAESGARYRDVHLETVEQLGRSII